MNHPQRFCWTCVLSLVSVVSAWAGTPSHLAPGELASPTARPEGVTPVTADQPAVAGHRPARDRAALFHEPGFPVVGAASDPEVLTVALEQAGWEVERVRVDQLADLQFFTAERFRLLVLSSGASFPLAARESLLKFLRAGGGLFTTGGYAFDNLVMRSEDGWQSYDTYLSMRMEAARAGEGSLLRGGDFEDATVRQEGWNRLSPDRCSATAEAFQGDWAARVTIPPEFSSDSAVWEQTVDVQPNERYLLRARMRTRDVRGLGFAYLAPYQLDEAGQLVTFRDVGQQRGDSDWTLVEYVFGTDSRTRRISLRTGLFQAAGSAWFDDVSLVPLPPEEHLNTRFGDPQDGLQVRPDQLGLFDASFALARAAQARSASPLLPADLLLEGPFEGFAAVAPLFERARWTPLLASYDGYGRPRGALGAMLYQYDGPMAGSTWAFFGVTNRDLFARDNEAMHGVLRDVFAQLRRNVFLAPPETDRAAYRPGESLGASVPVMHAGTETVQAIVRFVWQLEPEPTIYRQQQSVVLAPGDRVVVEAVWDSPPTEASDFCRLTVELADAETGAVWDRAETGAVVLRPDLVAAAAPLRFQDNYFRLGERTRFLCGTDTYANMFTSRAENPLRWREDVSACRDFGLNVFENLQYHPRGDWLTESQEREMEGLMQLCQQYRQAYMAGLWIGANVVVDDDRLRRQAEYCARFARHFGHVPALIHYLNGDFVVRFDSEPLTRELYGRYLRERYGTLAQLQAAWHLNPPEGDFGALAYNAPSSGWEDVRAADQTRFIAWLVRRWVGALTQAVRGEDPDHPITAEYYREPFGHIDLPLSIDGMDVSNIGYFDVPGDDLRLFPRRFAFTDMRAAGKSLNVGEFGVKTHPAWAIDRGGQDYHILRSEQEQHHLFLGLAHYALGLGGSKIQNWCWKDASERIFPWGLCYPNDLIPKDVAYTYRNISLLFRQFEPLWEPPAVYLLLPDEHRMGAGGDAIRLAALNGIQHLLHTRVPFAILHEAVLHELPDAARVIFYPLPYCPDDETMARLEQFVRDGGVLYMSGDFSFDSLRRRTRTDRLERLAGVRFAGDRQPDSTVSFLPAARFEPAGAEQFEHVGDRTRATHRVGAGRVVFVTQPYELRYDAEQHPPTLYRDVLALADCQPLRAQPDSESLHVLRIPTKDGGQVFVLVNMGSRTVEVTLEEVSPPLRLHVAAGLPGLAWFSGDGALRALEGCGSAYRGDTMLVDAQADEDCHWMLMSLDHRDVQDATSVLLIPFHAGQYRVATHGPVAVQAGDVRGGDWFTLTDVSSASSGGWIDVAVPDDLQRDLFLIGNPADLPALSERVADMLRN